MSPYESHDPATGCGLMLVGLILAALSGAVVAAAILWMVLR